MDQVKKTRGRPKKSVNSFLSNVGDIAGDIVKVVAQEVVQEVAQEVVEEVKKEMTPHEQHQVYVVKSHLLRSMKKKD